MTISFHSTWNFAAGQHVRRRSAIDFVGKIARSAQGAETKFNSKIDRAYVRSKCVGDKAARRFAASGSWIAGRWNKVE
jgi:hypothetical protein